MATLKDVARLANVDVSTVSRALNDFAYVHPDTKKRVYEAAKELSYQPNLLAKALRQGKRNTIGIIVPTLRMSVFSDIIESVGRYAQQTGYALLIAVTNDDPQVEKEILTHLRAGFVDGILIASTGKNLKLIREMQANGTVFVQIIREQHHDISSVVADYRTCSYDAVKFLYEQKGCRNIGFINGPMSLAPYLERYSGYSAAMKEYYLDEAVFSPENWGTDYFTQGYEGIFALTQKQPLPDGIMVAVDLQAMGAIRALKEKGIPIPEQIRLVSLTGNSMGNTLETTITALELPYHEVGEHAAKMLIDTIENAGKNSGSIQHMSFNHIFVERETT